MKKEICMLIGCVLLLFVLSSFVLHRTGITPEELEHELDTTEFFYM